MNRKEIKKEAWAKIKGNKWNIIWPALLILFVEGVLENILGLNPYAGADFTDVNAVLNMDIPPKVEIGMAIFSLVFGIVLVAYKKYILNFVRNDKFEFSDIIDCIKEKWLNILVASFLVYVVVFACTLLFVVPGIIMAFAYAMVGFIVIDSDLNGVDSMKKSRAMMKGYKWNYFVFFLSFIGWYLLSFVSFGIALIWLFPYMTVAETLYYEKLKEITK